MAKVADGPRERSLGAGVRAAAPFGIAVAAFGVAFGVLATSAGFGPLPAILMSATTFAGSSQFAAASILDAGGAASAAVVAAVLLNTRYAPIGISAASAFRGSLPRRLVESQLLVDESWALGHVGGGRYDRGLIVGAGLTLYASWLTGTAVGSLGADVLGDPDRLGLDAAFPALFLGLMFPTLRTRRGAAAALLGAGVATLLTPLTPTGVPIIAAAAVCLLGLRGPV